MTGEQVVDEVVAADGVHTLEHVRQGGVVGATETTHLAHAGREQVVDDRSGVVPPVRGETGGGGRTITGAGAGAMGGCSSSLPVALSHGDQDAGRV